MKDLLKALAESEQELEASPAVELRLRAAFRRKYARPKWPYFAMAAAIAIVVFFISRPKPRAEPQVAAVVKVTPAIPLVPTARPVIRKAVHRRPPPKEVMTDFYPLIEDAPPFERGELLRVSLPAVAMRGVGLPVSEDRLTDMVQADVLVGQEGLARAIRFVNTNFNRP
jgi:hypothetical protein